MNTCWCVIAPRSAGRSRRPKIFSQSWFAEHRARLANPAKSLRTIGYGITKVCASHATFPQSAGQNEQAVWMRHHRVVASNPSVVAHLAPIHRDGSRRCALRYRARLVWGDEVGRIRWDAGT